MRTFLFIFILLGAAPIPVFCQATGKGIIYLQGDNKLPFYVKFDGIMQPRYGKNHCIVSGIASGPHSIEVLFQQNKLASLLFKVQVSEDTPLTYLLYGPDNQYSLYDLHSKTYIQPDKK